MPDTMKYTKRAALQERAANAFWRLYWWEFWGTGLAASLGIASIAAALSAAHIELQYTAGAALILFARKLAYKKVTMPSPDWSGSTRAPVGSTSIVRQQKSVPEPEWEIH